MSEVSDSDDGSDTFGAHLVLPGDEHHRQTNVR